MDPLMSCKTLGVTRRNLTAFQGLIERKNGVDTKAIAVDTRIIEFRIELQLKWLEYDLKLTV